MPFNIFGADKKVTNTTVVSTDTEVHQEVGVSEGGIGTGAGGRTNSNNVTPSISDSQDVFAPTFNYANQGDSSNWLSQENVTKALAQNPGLRSGIASMLDETGDGRSPEAWLLADLQAGDQNSDFVGAVKGAAGPSQSQPNANINANAVQVKGDNSVGAGGSISAPIASGDDSIAIQAGGPVSTGDNSPAIYAGVSGGGISAPLSAGGDLNNSAPVIVGNTGTVNITTTDGDIARAAIDAAGDALRQGNAFAVKALTAVTEANKPAEERVTNNALIAVVVVVVAFGAFQIFKGKGA